MYGRLKLFNLLDNFLHLKLYIRPHLLSLTLDILKLLLLLLKLKLDFHDFICHVLVLPLKELKLALELVFLLLCRVQFVTERLNEIRHPLQLLFTVLYQSLSLDQ